MKVVFDTNILISAAIAKGKPHSLLIKAIGKDFTLFTSDELLEEIKEVMVRPKFKLSAEERRKFFRTFKKTVKNIRLVSNFKVVGEDPDDDVVLNTAHDAKADYIVSGDKHLLDLKEFKGMKIVTANKMLEIIRLSK